MKKIKYMALVLLCITIASCKNYLNETPQGVGSPALLSTPANVDGMVTAAYAALGNDHYFFPFSSMWAYGSIRSGDAYKGGGGPGDISEFNGYEVFNQNTTDNGATDQTWYNLYVGVGRANTALSLINNLSVSQYPNKLERQAEVRFIRGHFYFLLKILFKRIPYIDETIPKGAAYDTVSNRSYSSDALWTKIASDFRFAAANLPVKQSDAGRVTKGAAQAYLAKTLLYQAFTQDDQNNVTGIDQSKLAQVSAFCDSVINSGAYSLNADFANCFLPQYRNSPEGVFEIQFSNNDGTPQGRVDAGHCLDYPMDSEYGCCGFHCPSNNLVNAFKTDANGLPLFTTFNNTDVVPGGNYQSTTFDPRLDHTVAIPGHPYKYQTNLVYNGAWSRAPQSYNQLLSLKEVVAYTDPSFQRFPPFMSSNKNWDVIRYADVLLMKAEALIEMGQEMAALPYINMVRQRAINSTGLLKLANGNPTSNYYMSAYKPGVNCTWTNAYARQALRFERRLEFAMEGYRFFDLVRWGIADTYLNSYFSVEQNRTNHLSGAFFQKNRDEYLPIPLNQMSYSKGVYVQNTGW